MCTWADSECCSCKLWITQTVKLYQNTQDIQADTSFIGRTCIESRGNDRCVYTHTYTYTSASENNKGRHFNWADGIFLLCACII